MGKQQPTLDLFTEVGRVDVSTILYLYLNSKFFFFHQDKDSKSIAAKPSAPTPGKISAARNVFEKNSASVDVKAETVAPPKPPRTGEAEKTLTREKSSSKRKAPAPPTDEQKSDPTAADTPVPKPRSECKASDNKDYDHSVVSVKYAADTKPAKREKLGDSERCKAQDEPTPKPRKRRSGESMTDTSQNSEERNENHEDERAKRREDKKKARMENQKREGIISVTAQAVEILEGKNEAIPVQVITVHSSSNGQKPRTKVTVVNPEAAEITSTTKPKDIATTRKEIPVAKSKEICDKVVYDEPKKPITKSTSKPKEVASEFKVPKAAPTRPPPPQGISRFGSQTSIHSGLDELNETVNLNDVNIHEMTFTFDFSNFDKIQEDRETKFQKSFDEQQREVSYSQTNLCVPTKVEKLR